MAIKDSSGQMAVELVVVLPVVIVIALIATNAILFFAECAAFDRVARNAVRIYATSPAYEQTVEQSLQAIQSALDDALGVSEKDYLSLSVATSGASFGHTTFTATLEFTPTLFGLGLRDSILGVSLPNFSHSTALTVDVYKPGILF